MANKYKDGLKVYMNPDQISEAQELAKEFTKAMVDKVGGAL